MHVDSVNALKILKVAVLFLSYLVLMLISSKHKGTVISQIVNSLNICVRDDLDTE